MLSIVDHECCRADDQSPKVKLQAGLRETHALRVVAVCEFNSMTLMTGSGDESHRHAPSDDGRNVNIIFCETHLKLTGTREDR